MIAETILAETYLGNISESAELALRVSKARADNSCLAVTIKRSDRAKGRILTSTEPGQKVGIVKGRDWLLKDGDVLAATEHLVLVSIQSQTVVALTFAERNDPAALVQFGHVLGNRHWPVTVKEQTLYIELAADAALIESTLKETAARLGIRGLQIEQIGNSSKDALDFHTDSTHHH